MVINVAFMLAIGDSFTRFKNSESEWTWHTLSSVCKENVYTDLEYE
jgi:hypothetical protein